MPRGSIWGIWFISLLQCLETSSTRASGSLSVSNYITSSSSELVGCFLVLVFCFFSSVFSIHLSFCFSYCFLFLAFINLFSFASYFLLIYKIILIRWRSYHCSNIYFSSPIRYCSCFIGPDIVRRQHLSAAGEPGSQRFWFKFYVLFRFLIFYCY